MMPAAWRNFGMIPGKLCDQVPNKKFTLKEQAEMKLNDWHCVCNHILREFKEAQKTTVGTLWSEMQVTYSDHVYYR